MSRSPICPETSDLFEGQTAESEDALGHEVSLQDGVAAAAGSTPTPNPIAFAHALEERFLPDREVAKRYGVARQTVWRWVKAVPGFPTPVEISPGTTRWRLSELIQFDEARPRMSSGASK